MLANANIKQWKHLQFLHSSDGAEVEELLEPEIIDHDNNASIQERLNARQQWKN